MIVRKLSAIDTDQVGQQSTLTSTSEQVTHFFFQGMLVGDHQPILQKCTCIVFSVRSLPFRGAVATIGAVHTGRTWWNM